MNTQTKVTIVTGSGIGRQAALTFLKEGYAVALAGCQQTSLEPTGRD